MAKEKEPFHIDKEELIALVERIQRREPDSYKEMEKAVKDYLSRYFFRKTPMYEIEARKDMMAETLTAAYNNIDQLKKPEAFVTWLRSIAHSQIYHYHKKQEIEWRRIERAIELKKLEDERAKNRSYGLDLSNSEIRAAINKLPEEQRQAMLLKMSGLKIREIAKKQGVSEGTVKSRLNYARIKLRKEGIDS